MLFFLLRGNILYLKKAENTGGKWKRERKMQTKGKD
jgi:hypothetical protein